MDKGYIPVPNEIFDQLFNPAWSFSRNEIALLLFIARKTYGWGKQSEKISYSQFAKHTGIRRSNVWRTLHPLVERGIVFRSGDTQRVFYRINEAVKKWQPGTPREDLKTRQTDFTHDVSKSPRTTPELTSPMMSVTPPEKPQTDFTHDVRVTSPMMSELTSPVKPHIKDKKDTLKKTTPKSEIWGACLDLSLRFHQKQKADGLHHQDFKSTLTENSQVVTKGADTLEKLHRIEGESLEEIKAVLRFIVLDTGDGNWTGWKHQVISLTSLRTRGKSGAYKYFTVKNALKSSKAIKKPEPEAVTPSGHYGENGIWIPEK